MSILHEQQGTCWSIGKHGPRVLFSACKASKADTSTRTASHLVGVQRLIKQRCWPLYGRAGQPAGRARWRAAQHKEPGCWCHRPSRALLERQPGSPARRRRPCSDALSPTASACTRAPVRERGSTRLTSQGRPPSAVRGSHGGGAGRRAAGETKVAGGRAAGESKVAGAVHPGCRMASSWPVSPERLDQMCHPSGSSPPSKVWSMSPVAERGMLAGHLQCVALDRQDIGQFSRSTGSGLPLSAHFEKRWAGLDVP